MKRPLRGYEIEIRKRGDAEAIKILGYVKKHKTKGKRQ